MKSTVLLACLLTLALPHQAAASDTAISSVGNTNQGTPVKLSITSDLVKNFPIAVTATTTEDDIGITLGPKADGQYCTLGAKIIRFKDGNVKITATFLEETQIVQSDGTYMSRNVGFSDLSVVLAPGEEEVLFSSGDKKFTVKLIKTKK